MVTDNGKVGFVNHDNMMVIPAVFDYVEDIDYIFDSGVCVMQSVENEWYGAIDTLGNLILPFEYTSIFKVSGESTWYIRKDGLCGLADEKMEMIFAPEYNNIDLFDSESAYLTLNGIKQLVSFDGEVLLPFVVDEVVPLQYIAGVGEEGDDVYEQHPYLAAFLVDYKHWGVMDSRTGKTVLPAIYSDVDLVSKDLIMAEVDGNE